MKQDPSQEQCFTTRCSKNPKCWLGSLKHLMPAATNMTTLHQMEYTRGTRLASCFPKPGLQATHQVTDLMFSSDFRLSQQQPWGAWEQEPTSADGHLNETVSNSSSWPISIFLTRSSIWGPENELWSLWNWEPFQALLLARHRHN